MASHQPHRTQAIPSRLRLTLRIAAWVVVVAVIQGCASLPQDYPRSDTKAMTDTDDTRLGTGIAPVVAAHAGDSGFLPLGHGLDAFVARLALAEAAERTLDVQYYLFHDDATGHLLAAYLMRAAERGVRVRLLLDDMDMGGRDAGLAAAALHPNIEIRLFNPFPSRSLRFLDLVSHFGTVTRRMHNKSFTADNQVAVVGGRNIGDEYFEAADETNFGDMDVAAVGPIVHAVSGAFDLYWNSSLAYPVEALGEAGDGERLDAARTRLAQQVVEMRDSPYARRLRESNLAERLVQKDVTFYWGPARLLYDLPQKVSTDPDDQDTHMGPQLVDLISAVDKDLIVVSPYFIPGPKGTELFRALAARGVRVTVLTNSLAATDVPAVHAGYARYRRSLVEAGVEVYEMRPTTAAKSDGKRRLGESQASLHAKTLVFDLQRVLVGSMNLDPRSYLLNTEMGILVDSPELAAKVAEWRTQVLPRIAWRLTLEPAASADAVSGGEPRLVWTGIDGGQAVRHYGRDPEAAAWARVQAFILSLLPIERQL